MYPPLSIQDVDELVSSLEADLEKFKIASLAHQQISAVNGLPSDSDVLSHQVSTNIFV